MKIVIQCAASKDPAAGYFRSKEGTPVKFVADPGTAPRSPPYMMVRPDDYAENFGPTWREIVLKYNKSNEQNPFGLYPAWRLYLNPAYRKLVDRFGQASVYILSAGWGLIKSDFLTPQYDITFSGSADPYKRRRGKDQYKDFCQLHADSEEQIIFFGGKSYLPLFCRLTGNLETERIIFFNSKSAPDTPGCRLIRYQTKLRTNWHYPCADDFMEGNVRIH